MSKALEMEKYYKDKEEKAAKERLAKMQNNLIKGLGIKQKVQHAKDFQDDLEF